MDVQQFDNFSKELNPNTSGNDTLPAAMVGPAAFVVPLMLLATFVTLPSVLLNGMTLITLVRVSTISKPTRIILSSLSIIALVFEVGMLMWGFGQSLRALRWVEDNPASYSCRVQLYIVSAALYIRFLLNALFAVVMHRIIKRGIQTVRVLVIVIAIFVMSAVVLVCNIPMLTQTLYVSGEFIDGVSCNMQPRSPGGLLHLFGFWIVVSLPGTAMVVIFAVLSYRYVKGHVAAENDVSGCRRAMLRFSLSLIVTNILNIIAAFIPLLAVGTQGETSRESVQLQVAVRLIFYIVMDVSVLPQPILMMILFKPLRQCMKDVWSAMMSYARRIKVKKIEEDKERATSVDTGNSVGIVHNTVTM